jgi:hypothetical protein
VNNYYPIGRLNDRERHCYSILETCEKLRMAACGAFPDMDDLEYQHAIYRLTNTVEFWEPSKNINRERYDAAVLELVKATLAEIKQ